MEHITIQKLEEKDFSAYKLLKKKIVVEAKTGSKEAILKSIDSLSWEQYQGFLQSSPANIVFVAKDDAGVVYGVIECENYAHDNYRHVAHIWEFFVDKEYRGKDIGSRLLEALLDELKSVAHIEKVSLSVDNSMIEAIQVTKKHGFELVGTSKRHLKHEGHYYDEHILELFIDKA